MLRAVNRQPCFRAGTRRARVRTQPALQARGFQLHTRTHEPSPPRTTDPNHDKQRTPKIKPRHAETRNHVKKPCAVTTNHPDNRRRTHNKRRTNPENERTAQQHTRVGAKHAAPRPTPMLKQPKRNTYNTEHPKQTRTKQTSTPASRQTFKQTDARHNNRAAPRRDLAKNMQSNPPNHQNQHDLPNCKH